MTRLPLSVTIRLRTSEDYKHICSSGINTLAQISATAGLLSLFNLMPNLKEILPKLKRRKLGANVSGTLPTGDTWIVLICQEIQ